MPTLKKLFALLTPKERRRGMLLVGMMIVMACLEVAGVASIMPFLAVLGNPEAVQTNPILSRAYEWTGSPPMQSFLFALGVLAFVVIVAGAAFRALTHFAMARFVNMRRHSMACKLLQSYVHQPYEFFLNRNSADLSKSVLSEVDQVISNVLRPMVDLVAYCLVTLLILGMLIAVDVKVALMLILILGGAYTMIYFSVRRILSRIGKDRVAANKERFTAAGETFGGIKDIKLLGREEAYLKRFAPPSRRFARHQATNTILGTIPRFGVEAVAFGAILVVALYLLGARGDLSQVLPVLGLYAFAGYRLMPALQHVYKDLTHLRFGLPALDTLYNDLTARQNEVQQKGDADRTMQLNQDLELKDITYAYPGASAPALQNLSLAIPANTTVGFVGSTGAGKTTLVDIILGLLTPQQGQLFVDGQPIFDESRTKGQGPSTKNPGTSDFGTRTLRAWQRALGYVPQHIYLADETVTANIAFGIPSDKIDFQAVQHAAQIAALHDFIVQELPQGYNTVVGERGVRLSGGQRQRIGIARALYHDPQILVLDEATSSLDNVTEKQVMEAINRMQGERTIILIAHRLSTVKECDCIYLLEYGQLTAQGTYSQLLENKDFKKMAAVNE